MTNLARLTLFAACLFHGVLARADLVINEIMYHPASENVAEEFIELHNATAVSIDLSGWQFTSGVSFTFPAGVTIAPGGYLVIAANPATFHTKYPAVANYIAAVGWTGQLSNSGNKITLVDSLGNLRDEVSYTDDGDWGERRRDDPPDFGHRGWHWHSDADGFGSSLELVNAAFDNAFGENWRASSTASGTPGAANSTAVSDIAPVIDDAQHFPLVPRTSDSVAVTCRVIDDNPGPITVQVHYRVDGAPSFATAAMFDDGVHSDALASDGVFGGNLPSQGNGTIVEFYFTAADSGGRTRTWPAPARDYTGALVQSQNALYQVDDSNYAGAMPIYYLIMRAADKSELTQINTNSPNTPPFPFQPGENDQTQSHARFNATFISRDGTGTKLRYLTGIRDRGNGSRTAQPMNFSVQFSNEETWNGTTSLNLNTQQTPWQLFGSALYSKANLVAPESRAVQVRWNGSNDATGTGAPSYGFYVANEFQDSNFADHHFPLDSGGNLYRAQRLFEGTTPGGTAIPNGGDLSYINPAPGETLSQVDLYKLNYRKETNNSEDDWSDLIALTAALAKGHSGAAPNDPVTYDADYLPAVQSKIDVAQFVRWFAVETFADNEETNLGNGDGDDYYLYIGQLDPRGKLSPHDLDTILGRSGNNNPTHGIFRMTSDRSGSARPTPMNAFIKHPQIAPLYYGELARLLDGPFNPVEFDPFVDQILGPVAPATVLTTIKTFNATRHAFIQTQVPRTISVTNSQTTGGTDLTVQNGYPRSTAPAVRLVGRAHAVDTRTVRVNGALATWSAWQAQWTAANVALTPGINRILIQAFNASGIEIDRSYHDIWYDDATVTSVSGTIGTNTLWTAAAGPYQVSAALTVASGATLTIQPGTSVYLGSGVTLTVAAGGRIVAEGTEAQPIRFTRAPGSAGNGGTITINGQAGAPETHFYYTFFEFGGDPAVVANANSNIVLDHCEWLRTDVGYLHLDGGSFTISNCIFPTATGAFELVHGNANPPAGGRAIFRDSFFGRALAYNDCIDFTGGNRPGTIVQFLNNVFIGSDDDVLDLDGTDAWVEGNIFMHVHRNGSPDSSSAVSGGNGTGPTSGQISHVTIVGNLFYDIDQVATAKQGNFYTMLNNTVVDQNGRGSEDPFNAVINLADEGITEAAGMYLEGNIVHSAVALVRNYNPALSVVTMNNNILPIAWNGPGSGNSVVDPLLEDPFDVPTPNPRDYVQIAAQIRAQFTPQQRSPARGTGPNGTDKGGVRPFGASIGGAPVGITNQTSATLTVGTLMTGNGIPTTADAWPAGSGWTAYQWRLDGGAFSPERSMTTPITLSGLSNGVHTVEVIGKNDADFYQNRPEFGTDARVSRVSWAVDTNYIPPPPATQIRLNEVLAKNSDTQGFNGVFPDIIELFNPSTAPVDLSGWGLTDNAALPFKFAFSPGTSIGAGQYLVVYASGNGNVPPPRTGFGLKDGGDTITLTRSAAAGGGIADSISFGAQLSDYSIGRSIDGSWALCTPTFGAANVLAGLAPMSAVRINEWLADAAVLAGQDFIELMNTATLPVDVGLGFLTDNPSDWPTRHLIRQLTFIAPGGFIVFKADSDPEQGPDHVAFKLAPEQGEIGLFSPSLELIDNIVYGPQSTDVSQGRTPNGTQTIASFTQPTPGGPNPGVTGSTVTATTLLPINQSWKYRSNGTDHSGDFYPPTFNDSGWASGAQLLYIEPDTLTSPSGFTKQTALPADTTNSNRPYNTTYFRTHFNFTGSLVDLSLRATTMIDDGAIFYLNGHEIVPTNNGGARVRMPAGPVSFSTVATANISNASEETFTFDPTWLQNGDNVLAVEVHQEHAGTTQSSSDITFGLKLEAVVTNVAGLNTLTLNEVLPVNASFQNPDGSFAGWIEIYNPSGVPINLTDASLSDDPVVPRKFIFAPGTVVPAGGYLVITCNPLAAPSATNTGFGLGANGGTVLLFETVSAGGGLHDAVSYGRQIADFSIARVPNGTGPWTLGVPTRGGLNNAAATASLTAVKINEWSTNAALGFDFFELYNTATQPVPLGGNYLTDQLTNKTKQLIPPLSYIAGGGGGRWQAWIADNDNLSTPGHVNFTLEDGEGLGLFTAAGLALDTRALDSGAPGESRGHYPEASSAILSLMPTPGAQNQLPGAVDTDADGIPDAWETANGLDPNNPADAIADSDGDGQNNRAEYLAGTNPHATNDVLRASLVLSGGLRAIRFTAVAGKTYSVQYKGALSDPTWIRLTDVPAQPATTQVEIKDVTLGGQPQRFYRVITPQQP